ncbi:hypothetical protein GALMADRAFT_1241677 [Galerina marginata CBS 339.88]|uniref:HAT C-terminal dimerisation domain-containing protein n=1 Tax=Galerina marginata (strain CBS 339.88) TaxID=685588 RepID=A0A067T8H7_GALM3|nr:hypothetical protein GALMADRAFT_1241677 [Galerina marginata CBS 339.88]
MWRTPRLSTPAAAVAQCDQAHTNTSKCRTSPTLPATCEQWVGIWAMKWIGGVTRSKERWYLPISPTHYLIVAAAYQGDLLRPPQSPRPQLPPLSVPLDTSLQPSLTRCLVDTLLAVPSLTRCPARRLSLRFSAAWQYFSVLREDIAPVDALEEWLSSPIINTRQDPITYWTGIRTAGHSVDSGSTDVERSFSKGGLTISKFWHSLSDESARASTVFRRRSISWVFLPRQQVRNTYSTHGRQ